MLDFIHPSTITTAKNLLGQLLVYESPRGLVSGYIVETEAYLGKEDGACHSYLGKRTPKLESMYGRGGTIYIYSMHTHLMLNIVTKAINEPEAVLIRGLEPVKNKSLMEVNRGKTGVELSNGPGKLTKALGISKELDGQLLGGKLSIVSKANRQPFEISQSSRIGIPNKGSWTTKPLRFFVTGHPYVSGQRKRERDRKSVV